MSNKYSNVLTMILVVFIVAIIGIIGYFAYDLLHSNKVNSDAQAALDEFQKATKTVKKDTSSLSKKDNNEVENTTVETHSPLEELNSTDQPTTEEQSQQPQDYQKTYMEDYEVMGSIEIPRTGINYPILDAVTKRSIEMAVGIAWGVGLNQVGNTVIYGHNFRNGLFFSDNDKLQIGDLIYITDVYGNKVTYEIYKIYQTDENDASYFNRDTEGRREISLQTCTDDSKARIVIWAAEKM